MGLANPYALWLLLLLIPLIVAWKQRPRTRRLVGNAFLWQQVASPTATSFTARLRRSWLLVAQIAFLLSVVAALARPVWSPSVRTIAVILDLSASMGAREGTGTRLDAAIAGALSTIESLPRSTRVRLVAARAVPDHIGEYLAWDPVLRRAIRGQHVTAGPANISAAVEAARSGDDAPSEIHVFSDGPADASVRWVAVGQAAANAAITNVSVRRLPLSPEHAELLVETSGYSTAPLDTEIEITHNGSRVGRYPVRVPPRGTATIVVGVPGIEGIIGARLVADDALKIDNSRLALLPSRTPVRVLHTGGTFFVEQALAANRAILVDRRRELDRHDVVVCENCSELPSGDASVLMIPGPLLHRNDAGVMTVSTPGHPVARDLELNGLLAVPVDGRGRREAPAEGDAVVIARIAGVPAVLAYGIDGRRIVEVRMDVTDPAVAVSTAFPIAIANAIEWLAGRDAPLRELVAGEPLQWSFRGTLAHRPQVLGPAGRQINSVLAGRQLTAAATHDAGVYIVRGGASEEAFVVNPAVDGESDLSIASTLQPNTRSPAPAASRIERQIITPLIVLALGLVSAEWWLRCRATRRA